VSDSVSVECGFGIFTTFLIHNMLYSCEKIYRY